MKACIACMMSGVSSKISDVTAPNTTPTTTPASSRRSVCCTPLASASVSSTAATAPTNAAPVNPSLASHCVANGDTPNSAIASATPSDAPEALPSKYGSASGLRNSPCATAPAKPSNAPASQAPTVRGKRISQTISMACGSRCMLATDSKPVLPTVTPSKSKPHDAASSRPNRKTTCWLSRLLIRL